MNIFTMRSSEHRHVMKVKCDSSSSSGGVLRGEAGHPAGEGEPQRGRHRPGSPTGLHRRPAGGHAAQRAAAQGHEVRPPLPPPTGTQTVHRKLSIACVCVCLQGVRRRVHVHRHRDGSGRCVRVPRTMILCG